MQGAFDLHDAMRYAASSVAVEARKGREEEMTPEQFDAGLDELGMTAADFCRRTALVPNTAWRWRKGLTPIAGWVPEYLAALLELKLLRAAVDLERLHGVLVAVARPADSAPAVQPEAAEAGA